MCIKAGDNEIETVKNLMTMALNAIIATALDADLDDVGTEARLAEDLGMDAEKAEFLRELIADHFDGLDVDPATLNTVEDLLEIVVLNEFKDIDMEALKNQEGPHVLDEAA